MSKTFLFLCQNQFYFKQYSLTWVNIKTVISQVIQLSINTQFSSIWPIDRTLSGATTPDQTGPKSGWQWRAALHSPKLQLYWSLTIRLLSVISKTLQKNNRCILQPHPTGQNNLVWNVCPQFTDISRSTISFFKFWISSTIVHWQPSSSSCKCCIDFHLCLDVIMLVNVILLMHVTMLVNDLSENQEFYKLVLD